MNLRYILSLSLSALVLFLPACCWKTKRCCSHTHETVVTEKPAAEGVDNTSSQEEKAITKF